MFVYVVCETTPSSLPIKPKQGSGVEPEYAIPFQGDRPVTTINPLYANVVGAQPKKAHHYFVLVSSK